MDISSKSSWPFKVLSNFTPYTFTFRGVPCNSMEGLLQSLKFKDADIQKAICLLVGIKAKKKGKEINWMTHQTLYWQGKPIKRNSKTYQELLDEAFASLYKTNGKAQSALLASRNSILTHSIGKTDIRETILTSQEFCSRLMRLRKELKNNI